MNNQLIASDNFSSGSLAAGWGTWSSLGQSQVAGSPYAAEPTALDTTCGQLWNTISWPDDQISEVTFGTFGQAGDEENVINIAVRYQNPGSGNQGYQAIVYNPSSTPTLEIISVSAGTPTVLLTVTGFTINSGDVFTFAAIGSALLVYQNGARIAYAGDATVAGGGAPGFAQTASSSVSDCQIASWRGYSAQQPDGVWTKQGCVLPASADELANDTIGTGNTGFFGVSIGTPRFLSGSSVVRGYFVSGLGLCYAESPDGLNWTRYSGNPILSAPPYGVDVFFHGGTYYLLTQATAGSSIPHLYTSTDGLTFADQGACSGLSSGFYYGMHFADVIGGQFYGLFSGLGADDYPSTYLATSPDGKAWTVQNSSNPVIAGTFCGCQISKVGSSYYFWATQNQPGQGNPDGPDFDPYEAVRYASTDLVSWTSTHSLHNSLISDSLNTNTGGVAATSAISLGDETFLYYQGGPNDAEGNQSEW